MLNIRDYFKKVIVSQFRLKPQFAFEPLPSQDQAAAASFSSYLSLYHSITLSCTLAPLSLIPTICP